MAYTAEFRQLAHTARARFDEVSADQVDALVAARAIFWAQKFLRLHRPPTSYDSAAIAQQLAKEGRSS